MYWLRAALSLAVLLYTWKAQHAHRDSTVVDETHNQTYSETFYDEPLLFLTALNTVMKPTKKDLKSKQISVQTNFLDYIQSRLLSFLEILCYIISVLPYLYPLYV